MERRGVWRIRLTRSPPYTHATLPPQTDTPTPVTCGKEQGNGKNGERFTRRARVCMQQRGRAHMATGDFGVPARNFEQKSSKKTGGVEGGEGGVCVPHTTDGVARCEMAGRGPGHMEARSSPDAPKRGGARHAPSTMNAVGVQAFLPALSPPLPLLLPGGRPGHDVKRTMTRISRIAQSDCAISFVGLVRPSHP